MGTMLCVIIAGNVSSFDVQRRLHLSGNCEDEAQLWLRAAFLIKVAEIKWSKSLIHCRHLGSDFSLAHTITSNVIPFIGFRKSIEMSLEPDSCGGVFFNSPTELMEMTFNVCILKWFSIFS